MKRKLYLLIPLLVAVSHCLPVLAQDDSSWYDLGGTRIEKKFTQHISIKGEDLEKMSFANLSEAINVWLYGVYSNPSSLVYIVDGNIITDVNAWSIYDIDEIVLVQSALVQTAGNLGQQQFVLVTTRKAGAGKATASSVARPGAGSFSFRAAGQTALVNRDYSHIAGTSGNSEANFYHQYYISANYSRGKLQAGLSANWLRDVFPAQKSDTLDVSTPYHFNRYRFNGWLATAIGRHSQLYVSLAAVPETSPLNYTTGVSAVSLTTASFKETQFIVTPYLQFRTDLGQGWQNKFSAAWQTFNTSSNQRQDSKYIRAAGDSELLMTAADNGHAQALVIQDNLSLTRQVNNWTIRPALDMQYVYEKLSDIETIFQTVSVRGNPLSGGFYATSGTVGHGGKGHIFSAAPSISFSYKEAFSFGGGGFAWLPESGDKQQPAAFFPFAHVTIDLLRLGKAFNKNSLQVYGSVARNYSYSLTAGQLDDFSATNTVTPVNGSLVSISSYGYVTGGTLIPVVVPNQYQALYAPHTIWTTGASLHLAGDKLLLNYNFEKRNLVSPEAVFIIIGGTSNYYIEYPAIQSYAHHINVGTKFSFGRSFEWQPGITLTNVRLKGYGANTVDGYQLGDFAPHSSWTGGWVNRIRMKRFFAGLDILYHAGTYGMAPYTSTFYYQYTKSNSVDLQDIYVGFNARVCKKHDVEIYINSRNLAQTGGSVLTDMRRYYGAGFKTAF